MRHLIDSQVLIWFVDQDHLLTSVARAAIADPANDLLISAGTIWEIGIKVGLGKLSLSLPYRKWMRQAISDLGLAVLPITVEYAGAQAGLPNLHRDPFDRLLAAQAITDGLSLVSADDIFDLYGVHRIWK